jgi:hypothetical protein
MKVYGFYHENTYQRAIPTEEQNCYQQMLLVDDENTNRLTEFKNSQGWFKGKTIGGDWIPVRAVIDEDTRVFPAGDCPYAPILYVVPIFSVKAIESLRDLLQDNGELLPLLCDEGTYHVFNTTTVVDALDEQRSEFKPLQELDPDTFWKASPDEVGVIRHEFFPEKVADLSIFRIPFGSNYAENYPLVTDRFVQRVEAAGLKGFEFQLLWSSE